MGFKGKGVLGDSSSSYLANIASWADQYRETTAGKWSALLHFIDTEDNPPSSCNVDYDRDSVVIRAAQSLPSPTIRSV